MWIALVLTGTLLLLLANLLASLIALLRLDRFAPAPRPDGTWPLISVLIPARNEASTIAACVRSLASQDYPCLEILVLDDESTDATAALVAELAASDPRVRLLHGSPLPPGWLGKCHACHQLAQAARGGWLLFTDADTVHGAASIASALAVAEHLHVGMVSVLPRQEARTFVEQLIMPLLPLNILALLPVGLVRRRPEPSLSAGIGQFLFFRRAAYLAAGGHQAVRDRVLDDVELARRVKASGWHTALLDGGTAVRCRMYSSLAAIWQGFSKNLFDFYGRSPIVTLAAIAAHTALFVAPVVLAVAGPLARWPVPLVSLLWVDYGLAVAMRVLIAARLGTRGTHLAAPGAWLAALCQPLADLVQSAITLNSMRWGLQKRVSWKGRDYAPHKLPDSPMSARMDAPPM
jgi:chlorobactene glucosyltransferase